jgi:hypothetical protein
MTSFEDHQAEEKRLFEWPTAKCVRCGRNSIIDNIYQFWSVSAHPQMKMSRRWSARPFFIWSTKTFWSVMRPGKDMRGLWATTFLQKMGKDCEQPMFCRCITKQVQCRPSMGNIRPAGLIRPAKHLNVAHDLHLKLY